jgi:hypothetical protein
MRGLGTVMVPMPVDFGDLAQRHGGAEGACFPTLMNSPESYHQHRRDCREKQRSTDCYSPRLPNNSAPVFTRSCDHGHPFGLTPLFRLTLASGGWKGKELGLGGLRKRHVLPPRSFVVLRNRHKPIALPALPQPLGPPRVTRYAAEGIMVYEGLTLPLTFPPDFSGYGPSYAETTSY